jgi:hypothetical protein
MGKCIMGEYAKTGQLGFARLHDILRQHPGAQGDPPNVDPPSAAASAAGATASAARPHYVTDFSCMYGLAVLSCACLLVAIAVVVCAVCGRRSFVRLVFLPCSQSPHRR